MFDPQKLITESGDLDHYYIDEHAYLRACRMYGASHPPPSLVRSMRLNLLTEAYFIRRDFRLRHGLADDTIWVNAPQIIEPERLWA